MGTPHVYRRFSQHITMAVTILYHPMHGHSYRVATTRTQTSWHICGSLPLQIPVNVWNRRRPGMCGKSEYIYIYMCVCGFRRYIRIAGDSVNVHKTRHCSPHLIVDFLGFARKTMHEFPLWMCAAALHEPMRYLETSEITHTSLLLLLLTHRNCGRRNLARTWTKYAYP